MSKLNLYTLIIYINLDNELLEEAKANKEDTHIDLIECKLDIDKKLLYKYISEVTGIDNKEKLDSIVNYVSSFDNRFLDDELKAKDALSKLLDMIICLA